MSNYFSEKVEWVVCYDGTPQHQKKTSNSQHEAVSEAKRIIHQLKVSVNNKHTKIYPNEDKWELRIL